MATNPIAPIFQPQQPQRLSGNVPVQMNDGPGVTPLPRVIRDTRNQLQPPVTGGSLPPNQALPAQQLPQQQLPQQQFGLSGAEQAFQAGAQGGVSAIGQGQGSALNTLLAGQDFAQNRLNQGIGALGGDFSAQAQQVDPLTGQPLFREAAQGVGAFSPAGLQAQGLQSALSGAQGQEAFNQALLNSPVQQFLREQGQQSVINQASATGGLGGGEVQKELTRFGQGLAGTQLQQQIANLQNLSGQGLQAAGQQGQFLSQAGQQQGQLASTNAQLGTQANLASAANRLGAAQGQASLFGQGAGITAQLAGQGAGIEFGAGQNVANLLSGAGQNIGQARSQAGRDIASQIGQGTSALSQLASQQGTGLSDLIGSGSSNIANLLSGSGQLDAAQQQQMAQILANLSVGAGSNIAASGQSIGQTQQAGAAAAGQQSAQTGTAILGALAAMFSDERLKDDVVNIGKTKGHNIYSWKWNNLMPIKSLIGKKSYGVLAQEVESYRPDLITTHSSGFKMVNYGGL